MIYFIIDKGCYIFIDTKNLLDKIKIFLNKKNS